MDSDTYPNPTLRDLACEIGQVQIYWCFLENEMRRHLKEAGLQEQSAKGAVITHWRSYMLDMASKSENGAPRNCLLEVEEVARVRNLLAHGIRSVAADPWEANTAAAACVGPDGLHHHLSVETIRGLAEEIDRVRRSLRWIKPA
ncbi:hypothetical protein [Rhizobium sp. 18055]|uniref:hypothetical protein n=1 Tax=Rhizobium sp. 18055 TaxID=2681403 RepID=UPI00135AA912|nr:hypothetical protein [Rhizobium sp. 18055]